MVFGKQKEWLGGAIQSLDLQASLQIKIIIIIIFHPVYFWFNISLPPSHCSPPHLVDMLYFMKNWDDDKHHGYLLQRPGQPPPRGQVKYYNHSTLPLDSTQLSPVKHLLKIISNFMEAKHISMKLSEDPYGPPGSLQPSRMMLSSKSKVKYPQCPPSTPIMDGQLLGSDKIIFDMKDNFFLQVSNSFF